MAAIFVGVKENVALAKKLCMQTERFFDTKRHVITHLRAIKSLVCGSFVSSS